MPSNLKGPKRKVQNLATIRENAMGKMCPSHGKEK
jgi:hypothetical protein